MFKATNTGEKKNVLLVGCSRNFNLILRLGIFVKLFKGKNKEEE